MTADALDAHQWLDALATLATGAFETPADRQDQVLRTFFHLARHAPSEFRHKVATDLTERDFEGLLQAEAFESAAFRLVERACGAMVSFAAGGKNGMASVWIPHESNEKSGGAASVSLALIGCTCAAIFEACTSVEQARVSARLN